MADSSTLFNTPTDHDGGSFVTGFAVGLFAGAFGYFLFATDRGQSVREELVKEWQAASQKTSPTSEPSSTKSSDSSPVPIRLKKILTDIANNWLELDQAAVSEESAAKPKSRRSAKPAKPVKSAQKKFKGT